MNPSHLKAGMQCTVSDGSLVEVQQLMPDDIHVKVKYLDSLDNPEIAVGDLGEIPYEELIAEYMGTHAEGLT